MAIYHLSMKPMSRSSGRSAVAAIAYRAAEKLTNERDGIEHDFTRRQGVEHAEIVLPEGIATGADWARERAALWNAAERAEARKDARVAREIEVALPHELTAAQRLELTREFSQSLADRYGVAVDFAIHSPHGHTDIRNHHAHIMLTTRKVGEWGLAEKSELELENKKLAALGLPTTHDQLRDVRIAWEQRSNTHLARAGLDLRIDHRSHQERGLELEPTQHMGVHATQMERRHKLVSRVRIDEDAARRNAAIIREKPEQVLTLITNEKSVFDRQDVARALHRYIGEAEPFQNALAQVMTSPALVQLQAEQRDETGRVVESARYSTREMVNIERDMAMSAERMEARRDYAVAPRHVAAAAERQNTAIQRQGGKGLEAEQRVAIEHVTGPERIAVVVGMAGAGKSTMLMSAREAWQAQGYRVHGAALAGKAAEGLEESSGIASRTLASWERGWERGFDKLGPRDVFVIDEAGMVGSKQLSRFITEADQACAKIVLVGDPEQLQPIGAGAAFRAVAERVGMVELEGIRRQREDWQRAASIAFGRHRTEEGLAAYAARDAIRFEGDTELARSAIVRDVMADRDARPDGSRLVLAHRRVDVAALNDAIRDARQERGELTGELVYQTSEGARAFAPGDRLLFRENNRELGVKNGMLGTVERAEEDRLTVRLDSAKGPGLGRAVEVSTADYAAVDHGYATTIHKAQGATVDRAYVLVSKSMDRHLTYVAMTRHRDGVALYAGRDEFSDMDSLAGRLSRAQLKETTLDYDPAGVRAEAAREIYAQRRGMDHAPESEIIIPPAMRAHQAPERMTLRHEQDQARPAQARDATMLERATALRQDAMRSASMLDGLEGKSNLAARFAERRTVAALEAKLPELAERLTKASETLREIGMRGIEKVIEKARERVRPEGIVPVQKAQEAPERQRAVERPAQKRSMSMPGMFDGLKLGGGRGAPEAERPAPAKAADTLHQAVDRYARAYDDAARMRAQDLPILDHQRLALRDAGQKLDAVRPGAHADLKNAVEHNPDVATALRTMQGQPRTALLVYGIRQEERIRQDPNLQAERLVKVWSGLEAEHRRLKGWEHDEARGKVETRMKAFVADLKRDPQLESILRNRQQELGVSRGSRLDQVMRERDIDRAMTQSIRQTRGLGRSI
jgi:Ti-type conjugative transfer relaxase TraA